MNKDFLKESVQHGTIDYAYAQYHIRNLLYPFYMSYHWHDEIEIIYVKKGKLRVIIDDMEYSCGEGDMYFVNPGQIHTMHTEDLSVEYYTILFNMNLIEFVKKDEANEYFFSIMSGKIKLPTQLNEHKEYKKIVSIVDEMVAFNLEKSELYKLDTKVKILQLMSLLLTSLLEEDEVKVYSEKNIQIKRSILTYIEDNYTSKISLADIAKVVHMSEKYFSRFFKENFGITFVEYVNRVRLEKAAKLLQTTEDSVTEIALLCGYSNISYFIRSFKNSFGVSPHKFRNNISVG